MAEEPVWLTLLWLKGSSVIPWHNPLPHQVPSQIKIILSECSARVVGDHSSGETGFYGN